MKLVFNSKWGRIPVYICNNNEISVNSYGENPIANSGYFYNLSLRLFRNNGVFNYNEMRDRIKVEKTYDCVGKFGVDAPPKFKATLLESIKNYVNHNINEEMLNKAEIKYQWNSYKRTRSSIKETLNKIHDLQNQRIEQLSTIKKLRQTM